jgi:hypothetical protein
MSTTRMDFLDDVFALVGLLAREVDRMLNFIALRQYLPAVRPKS